MKGWWDSLACLALACLAVSLVVPSIVGTGCGAAKESRAANLIAELEGAAELYERDWGRFPPMSPDFESGPCVYVLSQLGPMHVPYIDFVGEDLMDWPPSPRSHLRNPVDPTKPIYYRDNTSDRRPVAALPAHNRYGIDIWAEDSKGRRRGINNWRASE
ncbi:MAG TPA: hypothetical protein VI643_01935 [Planctomycetota bacterium]|nr:hypothetical protein [Planctomycetota bacterium]